MWIRLKSNKIIDRAGKNHTYHVGDWVDVGKQTALLWMAQGDAEIPSYRKEQFKQGEAGVLIRNAEKIDPYQDRFDQTKLGLTLIVSESPYVAFDKTLIWHPKALLRSELIGAGFGFLDTWEIAMPLYSYDELAIHIGGEADRAKTKAVIRDLRVPVYDTRLIYVKHCENTQRLFTAWLDECEGGGDERLAFMRAFYQIKPLMLALPITWHTPRAYAEAV